MTNIFEVMKFKLCAKSAVKNLSNFSDYRKYGPITNDGIRVHSDAAICYRTILRVTHHLPNQSNNLW